MLRLRHAMALGATLNQTMTVWNATENTLGFVHGFGSARDGKMVLLETQAGYTAMFSDNDAREQHVIVNGQNIASPRENSVFRANHGYDPKTIQNYAWNNTHAYAYSIDRYLLVPGVLDDYTAARHLIDTAEAVNVTALVADKGGNNMYDCGGASDATNVLSVTYDPANLKVYVAWENGHGPSEWTPAACNTYLEFRL